ncbi:MAG: leucine-rich repeat protein [Clostridia bacterium]|nr:leucine-rich repeat protein [Clostridia bacterium]
MSKKCPGCGKELPEESNFCLSCFYSFDKPSVSKRRKPLIIFFANLKSKITKRVLKRSLTALASLALFLLVMGICIVALKNAKSSDPVLPEPETTVIAETLTIPVTQENGEAVTDENGEDVFQVVEVTKTVTLPPSTTEKKGFFDKIFDSDTKNNSQSKNDKTTDGKNTATTEKKGFFDQLADSIFGDKEETTENRQTTAEEHATTPATTAPSTTSKPATTTEKTTQATATTVGTTAVTTTPSGSYYFEYEPLYPNNLENSGNRIRLTKYVGDASIVTVPCSVDGKPVAGIYTDCFIDNSKIKEIHFDDTTTTTISLYSHSFNNLSSLTKIVTNNKGVHMNGDFACKCPITYIGKDGSTNNKLIDGAYYKGTVFYWFTDHPSYTTLTLPDWCTKIDNSSDLGNCSNLKVLNIHKNVSNVQTSAWDYGDGLKEINVEKGHPTVFSHDGVMFYKWSTGSIYDCIYPYSKTDKTFKVPENCYLSIGKSSVFTTNPYLEEVWLSSTSYLKSPDSKYMYDTCYPNLKRIYISPDHPQYDKIAKTFKGELIVKDF